MSLLFKRKETFYIAGLVLIFMIVILVIAKSQKINFPSLHQLRVTVVKGNPSVTYLRQIFTPTRARYDLAEDESVITLTQPEVVSLAVNWATGRMQVIVPIKDSEKTVTPALLHELPPTRCSVGFFLKFQCRVYLVSSKSSPIRVYLRQATFFEDNALKYQWLEQSDFTQTLFTKDPHGLIQQVDILDENNQVVQTTQMISTGIYWNGFLQQLGLRRHLAEFQWPKLGDPQSRVADLKQLSPELREMILSELGVQVVK